VVEDTRQQPNLMSKIGTFSAESGPIAEGEQPRGGVVVRYDESLGTLGKHSDRDKLGRKEAKVRFRTPAVGELSIGKGALL